MSLPGQPPGPPPQGGYPQAPTQAPQYLPMSARAAAEQQQELTNRGIGTAGDYGEITWYKWKEATQAENQKNQQAGENLLWVMPKLAHHPNPNQLGRLEASHFLKHLGRGFRCVESMFPERRDARCAICDVLRQVSQLDGVDTKMVKKHSANMKFNLNVVDVYEPQKGVQVASITAVVYRDMLAHLLNEKIQDPLRDFTNPYAARPWQIHKVKANVWKYNASIYGGMNPQPMAWLQDGRADVDTINRWLSSCPNLWEIITWPSDEHMVEINATAYDLLRFYQQQASISGGVSVPNNYPYPGAQGSMPVPAGMPFAGNQPTAPQTVPQTIPQNFQPPTPTALYNPPVASSPIPGASVPGAPPVGPGYNPENVPPMVGETTQTSLPQVEIHPQNSQQAGEQAGPGAPPPAPAAAVPVNAGFTPPAQQAPPGFGDQSVPPPSPMPGQTSQGGPVCFGQHSDQRIMCTTCSKNTECAEATPKG